MSNSQLNALKSAIKTGLPLIGDVLQPLTKNILIPLGVTATASAADADTQKKVFRSSFITLIISNEEINDIMKIVKSLEECVSETI